MNRIKKLAILSLAAAIAAAQVCTSSLRTMAGPEDLGDLRWTTQPHWRHTYLDFVHNQTPNTVFAVVCLPEDCPVGQPIPAIEGILGAKLTWYKADGPCCDGFKILKCYDPGTRIEVLLRKKDVEIGGEFGDGTARHDLKSSCQTSDPISPAAIDRSPAAMPRRRVTVIPQEKVEPPSADDARDAAREALLRSARRAGIPVIWT